MVEAILLYVLLQTSRVVIQIKLSNVSFKIKYKNKRMTQNTCLVLLYLSALCFYLAPAPKGRPS
jgi:hypothetical protein